jgi:oligopeptide transport system ATP-binding protein
MSPTLLAVRELRVAYRGGGSAPARTAVDGVSFELAAGESLGLVGESGSGKSSIARALLRLVPARGVALFEGQDLLQLRGEALRATREHLQIIFQDPLAALDPRLRIAEIVGEPLREFRPQLGALERRAQVVRMLERVGLDASQLDRYPHEFSGGQAQRIGIARALMLGPRLLICDEPVASLDVSITAQIVNLLRELQRAFDLSLLFIAHDLATVRQLCGRVMVLYRGQIMEIAPREQLYSSPRHPYTTALLAAVPTPDPSRAVAGALPVRDLGDAPRPETACVFRHRCPQAFERCAAEIPTLRVSGTGSVACHLPVPQA